MALSSKERVTPQQLKLAKRVWVQSGGLNFEKLIRRQESVKDVRKRLRRLLSMAEDLAASPALRELGMEEVASGLSDAMRCLETATATAKTRAGIAQGIIEGIRSQVAVRPRARGGVSRASRFVQLMFEADPRLPRSAAWWLVLDDALPVSPNGSLGRQERRDYWKTLLRRVPRPSTRGRIPRRVSDPESRVA